MAIDRSKPLKDISFYCASCINSFYAEPQRVEDAPELEHHPFAYFSACPKCGKDCEQSDWQKNLMKAWAKSTGPKTEEGKAATTANLKGHPTPEETLRTRFNAMKHGMNAKVATYFPAKPDGYSFCEHCDVDRVYCASQPACVKKTELFMLHQAAFDQKNPKHLMGIYSDLQASIFALVQQIIQTIITDGVKIELVKWYSKDGEIIVADYIDEHGNVKIIKESVMAHPLFKPLGELLSRNGLSLADMGMTNKSIEADEDSFLGGLSDKDKEPESLTSYQERQMQLLATMAEKIQRSNQRTDSDPILLEYQQESGG